MIHRRRYFLSYFNHSMVISILYNKLIHSFVNYNVNGTFQKESQSRFHFRKIHGHRYAYQIFSVSFNITSYIHYSSPWIITFCFLNHMPFKLTFCNKALQDKAGKYFNVSTVTITFINETLSYCWGSQSPTEIFVIMKAYTLSSFVL